MSFLNKLLYAFVIFWFRLLAFLPIQLVFFLSELLTFIVYYIIGYRRKVVETNLKNSFPEKNEKEIERISRKYYRHLSVMIVENVFLRFVSKRKLNKRIEFENIELLEQFYENQKNIIIMLGHFGNWEYAACISRFSSYKSAAVYKKLTSPVFDKIYYDIRNHLGSEPIEMAESFRKVSALNNANDPFALIMVADQSPMQSDSQHWMRFMNQDTGVFLGSEKLAKRFDFPVFYLHLHRTRKGSYKGVFKLISDKPKESEPKKITEKYFKYLEESIKDNPRNWLWSHRRWKNTPPEKQSFIADIK